MPRCLDDPGLPRPDKSGLVRPGFARCLLLTPKRLPKPPFPFGSWPRNPRATGCSTLANQQSARNRLSSQPARRSAQPFLPRNLPIQLLPATGLTCSKTGFCGDIAPVGAAQCLTIYKNLLTSTYRRVIYSRVRTASVRHPVGHTSCVGYEVQGDRRNTRGGMAHQRS